MAMEESPRGGGGSTPCCRPLVVTPMHHKGLLGWKYDCRCNYMVSLATSPRQGVFGELREWGVERSRAGKAVYDAWQAVSADFPAVRATYNAVMPDHFHGIVFITRDGAAALADVVSSFAADVERRLGRRVWDPLWRDSVCLARGQLHRQIQYVLSNPRRRWIKEHNPGLFRKMLGFRHGRLDRAQEALRRQEGGPDDWDFRAFARLPPVAGDAAECWDLQTGAEILKPRRGNRLQPAFCTPDIPATTPDRALLSSACCHPPAATTWTALGNPFLLDEPCLVSVRISTRTPPDRLARLMETILAKVARGAVLVSPWISPGEKDVKAAALAAGGRVVQLLPEGMGPFFKPAGRDFGCCAEGQLLLLTPFGPPAVGDSVRFQYGKPRFEWLNLAARAMADLALGVSRADLEGA